jgi:signal transduction histidine kinase
MMENHARNIQVLLIEDSRGEAELIKISLRECTRPSFRVHHCGTLALGLEHLRKNDDVDVILLDLTLPDASGERTVMLTREAVPERPIVILTGYDDPDFADEMLAHGAQDYIIKGSVDGLTISRIIRYAITRMRQTIVLESMLVELRNAIDMKNKMFGILAHELRNPIGAISGWVEIVEMIEGDSLTENTKKAHLNISDAAKSMNLLIEDVLAIAIAEAGALKLNRERLDVHAIALNVKTAWSVSAKEKQIAIVVTGDATWIKADMVKIQQTISNLIGNAVKFSNPGETIEVNISSNSNTASISVTDHGVGIPPNIRSQLFIPFCKGQKGTANEPTNGLGLYICSMIILAHQGSIDVESSPGKGSTFTITLPIS